MPQTPLNQNLHSQHRNMVEKNHFPAATLYIHIPFCVSKCDYCSFVSYPAAGRNISSYMEALSWEAGQMATHHWTKNHVFTSLYVGGGTPTIASEEQLASLIEQCLNSYSFVPDPEVTVEANPNTVSLNQLQILRLAGVNRLSIGIQAFSDDLLQKLGRSHNAKQALKAFEFARSAGHENISIDLIYGLPEQNMEQWLDTVAEALALEPEHCAMYELMIEEGTKLDTAVRQGRLTLPHENLVLAMQMEAEKHFAASGFHRYEISNYTTPGRASRHNIHYWQNGSYIGLGAGSVSCLSGVRLNQIIEPDLYADMVKDGKSVYRTGEALGSEAHFRETVIMGLRMIEGVSISVLHERFGLDLQAYYGEKLDQLQAEKLIFIHDDCLRLTEKGLYLANQVLAELV